MTRLNRVTWRTVNNLLDAIEAYFQRPVEGDRVLTATECDDIRRLLRELRDELA